LVIEPVWYSANQTAEHLKITLNHLRQLQFRKQLVWKSKQGKAVFYLEHEVLAFEEARRVKHEVRQAKSTVRA
jgi:hypothetical protein